VKLFSFSKAGFTRDDKRPYEVISEALQAWGAGDAARAHQLFRKGIAAYQSSEPDGVDFAFGRYGAFLLDQGYPEDAERVLQKAIELKTAIPAIWSDYVSIFASRLDVEAFKGAVARLDLCRNGGPAADFLLTHARAADREGATVFAQELARWVIESCLRLRDQEGRWAAIGDLGRILERAGQLEEAMRQWRDAFKEGSRDPETIARLSMHLERAKEYGTAVEVIREGLTRGLPANTEEALRKRLARCEEKAAPAGKSRRKRGQIPAFSVRKESAFFETLFQARLKSSVADLAVVNNAVRCILTSKESSTLVDFDCQSGDETRRVENLPRFTTAVFASDGRAIGICRTAAVGRGPTLLRFLSSEGQLTAEASVPDATSEVAIGPDLWYVGCRNGFLYAFGLDGRQRWAWETPGARESTDNAYFRSCPYYVSSHGSFAVVASMGNVYAVSPSGKTLWRAAIPNEHQTKWNFTVPIPGGVPIQQPYKVLGLPAGAPRDQVKSAYRHLALATHPDRNPTNSEATANFLRIQEAYEQILAGRGDGASNAAGGITISFEIQGMGPTVSFIAGTSSGAVIGSSQGRIYTLDGNGNLRDARVLGDGAVRVALRTDGTLGAAWCDNAVLFFRDGKVINAVESVEWPRDLAMWGEHVVLWRRSELTVLDAFGRTLYALEFSKTIAGVTVHDNVLYCAAGILAAFRHRY
jgi:tetratricopeptide (TPR) repeat protein